MEELQLYILFSLSFPLSLPPSLPPSLSLSPSCVVWRNTQLICGGILGSLSLLDSVTLNIISNVRNHTGIVTVEIHVHV